MTLVEDFEFGMVIGNHLISGTLSVDLYKGEVPIGASISFENNAILPLNFYSDSAIKKVVDDLIEQRAADKSAEIQEAEENGG